MDYQALLYSPIYVSLGVTAELVTSAGTSATVTVLDKTTGIDVGTDTIVETIKPACIVRAAELNEMGKGIAFVLPVLQIAGVAHFMRERPEER